MKAFADDKVNAAQKMKFAFGRIENIAGKGENAGYQHFLLFLQCFQKASSSNVSKVVNGKGLKAFAGDTYNVPQEHFFQRIENIVKKEKMLVTKYTVQTNRQSSKLEILWYRVTNKTSLRQEPR